jgi:hypothetical protein
MARRKYSSDKPSEPPPPAPEPSPAPAGQQPQPDATSGSSLREQLDAMRHPQQPQQPQLDPVDHWILQTYPGLSEPMFHYLRSRPQLAAQPQLAHAAHAFAQLHAAPESPEYFGFIDHLIKHHDAAQYDSAHNEPTPPPEPSPAPEPVTMQHAPPAPPPPAEPEPAAHTVAAPPSHGHVAGFEPDESPNTIRLSAAEREHAKASGVSETEYAKQKLRMQKAKKAGLIKD